MVDAIARRYGILPHLVLELDTYALTFAWVTMQAAADAAARAAKRLSKAAEGSMVPCPLPVVVIPSPLGGM